jgi:intergrase/recombinase
MSDYWINRKKTIKNYLTALNRIDLYDDIVNKAVQADEQMRSLAKLLQSLGTIINQEQADIILSTYAS